MSLEVSGKLIAKYPTQQIKENFSKREFVIELADQNTTTGAVYVNYASFQLVNNGCAAIDNFNEGDTIKVSFSIRGNRWEKDGQVRYITNLNAWRIEPAGAAQQPVANAGGNYAAPQQGAPTSYNPPAPPSGDDDLPF